MGYVHMTDISQFISPLDFTFSAGTWTPTVGTNMISNVRSAADAEFNILVPILLPSSLAAVQAAKLVSFDFWYRIQTAACDDFATVALYRNNLPADTVAVDGTAIAVTADAAHDTAAERLAEARHKMTLTVDAPVFLPRNTGFHVRMLVDAHLNTVFTCYGAQANFVLRL
jgi:hypothetical protein